MKQMEFSELDKPGCHLQLIAEEVLANTKDMGLSLIHI